MNVKSDILGKFFAVTALLFFVHSSFVLPFLELEQIHISSIDVVGDKEVEREIEELEDVIDQFCSQSSFYFPFRGQRFLRIACNFEGELYFSLPKPPPKFSLLKV